MNISNGGLISQINDKLFICDLENYSGTDVVIENGFPVSKIQGMMWFSNVVQHQIFYSNQKDNDYLYCFDTLSNREYCVLPKPCHNIMFIKGSLYYIDEADDYIYEFNIQNGNSFQIINETALSFIAFGNNIYYSTNNGLKKLDLYAKQIQKLCDAIPICMNMMQNKLIFSNKSQNYTLNIFDLSNGELFQIDEIKTQSIITDDRYIYASNTSDNMSIARIDIFAGEIIRICGEKTEKLHIISNDIYFQNQNAKNAWYKMPLSGGQIMKVIQ